MLQGKVAGKKHNTNANRTAAIRTKQFYTFAMAGVASTAEDNYIQL